MQTFHKSAYFQHQLELPIMMTIRLWIRLSFLALGALGAQVLCAQMPPHEPWMHGSDSPESPGAVTDGNPQTTVAQAAGETVLQALPPVAELEEEFQPADAADAETEAGSEAAAGAAAGANRDLGVEVGFGSFDLGGVTGDVYTVRIPYTFGLSPRAKLALSAPVSVTNIEDILVGGGDAQVFGGGLNAALQYGVFTKEDDGPYRWRVTPSAGVFYRESDDLNAGSWVFNAGLSSSFSFQPAEDWIVNIGNSVLFAFATAAADYPDPERREQQVLTNGVQVIRQLGRWSVNGYVMDTRFLQDALVDDFQTYAAGVGFKITRNRSLRVLAVFESGDAYDAFRVTCGSTWKF